MLVTLTCIVVDSSMSTMLESIIITRCVNLTCRVLTRTAGTCDGGQEAGGLADVTLSFVIRKQLKGLPLCFHSPLNIAHGRLLQLNNVTVLTYICGTHK